MDREALLAMLISRYEAIATEAGMAATDTANGWAPVLDAVAATVATLPELDPVWIEPLARYEALDYLADRLASQMDITTGRGSYKLNQLFTNVAKRLDVARAVVAWIIAPADPGTVTSSVGLVTRITTPFLSGGEWEDALYE